MLLASLACFYMKIPKPEDAGWYAMPSGEALPTLEDYRAAMQRHDLADCPPGDAWIGVPGYWGDGPEWQEAAAFLPGRLYIFRWSPNADVNVTLHDFVHGVDRLARCPGDVFVIGHSAGGLLVSFAAERFAPQAEGRTWVLTVAAPIAGTGTSPSEARPGEPMAAHQQELVRWYGRAAPGVRGVHLRTNPLVDPISDSRNGHDPIDPRVGIPGALQIDLPRKLGHDPALIWTAERLGDGRWRDWFPAEGVPTPWPVVPGDY